MTEHQPTISLTQEQIDFYHQNGFLTLDSITTQGEVEWLRQIYDRLFEQRAGREQGDQFDLAGTDEEGKAATLPQILAPSKYAPELLQGLYRANALSVARQLLGEQAQAHGEHAIFKPAKMGAPTPWHQDEAYWSPSMDYNEISLWIPLQPATLENGCMQFVPKSHWLEVQPHRPINNDPRIHGLEVEDGVDVSQAVPCPIPAGGATIHHCRTLHYAGPNTSDIPRRAYILTFGLEATPSDQSRDFSWQTRRETAREKRAQAAQS